MSTNANFNKPSRTLVLAFILSTVSAVAQASDNDIAESLLVTTGVASHLANASQEIFSDAVAKYSGCFAEKNAVMSEGDGQQLKSVIEQHFSGEVTVPRAIDAINDAMDIAEQEAVQDFFESPIGARIVAAEVATKDYDEQMFDKLMDRHLNSSAWGEPRLALIESVYDSTRSARFFSTLNGEILAASALSGHCDTSAESLDKLQPHLETLRSESQFIEPLMHDQLVRVIATIFRNIPNSDLIAYVEFAQSDLGVKFFDALLSSTASSLSEGAAGLRLSVQK